MGESGVGARRRTLAARRCGARGPIAEVVLRVSGSEVSTREAPAGILEGSGGFEVAGGEEIAGATVLTWGGSGWKIPSDRGAMGCEGGRRCSWFHEGGPAAAGGGWEAVAWPLHGGVGERQGRAA